MLITTKYRSSLNFGSVTLIVLELCPFKMEKLQKCLVSVLLLLLKFVPTKYYGTKRKMTKI